MIKANTIELYGEQEDDLCTCDVCGNSDFKVFITVIIDDARLYCSVCGKRM